MFRNYILIAYRNLVRHKSYTLINIFGLATGIAACILIYLYVQHELSFDKFNKNANNIYRVVSDYKFEDKLDNLSVSSPIIAPTLKKDYPEVVNFTRISPYSPKLLIKYNDKKIYEKDVFVADSNFFVVFDYQLIKGNAKTVLNEPNTVAINQTMAKKYFANEDPIGKILKFDNNDGTFANYKVTGVFKDVPSNSQLQFNALVSFKTLEVLFGKGIYSWINSSLFTYIQLAPNTDYKGFEKKIEKLYDKYAYEPNQKVQARVYLYLEPLTEIHLHSKRLFDVVVQGSEQYVYIFSMVAIFLLIIACINYMNLATARAKIRMKEIGMRKVVGASRKQLIMQYVSESAVITILSMIMALILTEISMPLFNQLTGIPFTSQQIYAPQILGIIGLITISVILLAGVYPAFYLTSFNPVEILKGSLSVGKSSISLRKILVIFQFSISIALISATIVVYNQLHFMQNYHPGFNKEDVIAIRFQDTITATKYNAIKEELKTLSCVQEVSQAVTLPGDAQDRKITRVEGKTPGSINEIPVEPIWVDMDYFKLMQMELKEGRFFDKNKPTDFIASFIVNESAAKKLGWDKSLGKKIIWGYNPPNFREGKVIGVVKDVHTSSLKNAIEPIVFIPSKNPGKEYQLGYLLIKIKPENRMAALEEVLSLWKYFDAEHPVDFKFLDENVAQLYLSEKRVSKLFTYFSMLTIIIACLGLFGLASFTTSQRTKEIGIRKVLGSSITGIILLLSKDFIKLVLIAFLIAAPISYLAMNKWLEAFAFHINISWLTFVFAGVLSMLIALLTLGVQATKAAIANPVKSLRYE